jgi:hypothetical protein
MYELVAMGDIKDNAGNDGYDVDIWSSIELGDLMYRATIILIASNEYGAVDYLLENEVRGIKNKINSKTLPTETADVVCIDMIKYFRDVISDNGQNCLISDEPEKGYFDAVERLEKLVMHDEY